MELASKGVMLLLLDVPQHTVLSVDTQVFSVGPRFRGIKMVPPGPHFLHYCSPSRHGNEFAPTVGFFLTTHPSETSLLETVLAKNYQGQEDLLLGELQFSFIAFMMGQSLEAFMQWKALVSLLLSCSEAPLHTRTQMFVKFIRVIYYQFKHGFQHTHDSRSSDDKGNSLFLDEAWFSRDIFLYRLSKDFLTVIFEAQVVDGDLLSWARKLKTLLETTFGWDLENNAANLIDEDDEFAPVVVEMDGS